MTERPNINIPAMIGAGLAAVSRIFALPFGRRRGARLMAQLSASAAPLYRLTTPLGLLKFRCPSPEAVKAAARFAYDEPETRVWIETIVKPGDAVWDIGANVGLYTLYTALRTGDAGRVLAFEPGASNYAALNANIALNGLSRRIDAYCAAMSDETRVARFHLSNADAGKAGHWFGEGGGAIEAAGHEQSAIGFSIDGFIAQFGVRAPDHIKLDVDSIEDRILRGGAQALARVKSVLVENNIGGPFADRDRRIHDLLVAAGLVMNEELARAYPEKRNRIYVRPGAI